MLLVVAAHGVGQRAAAVGARGQLAARRLVGALGLVVGTLVVSPLLNHLQLLRALRRDHCRHLRERDRLAEIAGAGRAHTAQVRDVARGAARAYERRGERRERKSLPSMETTSRRARKQYAQQCSLSLQHTALGSGQQP